MIAAESPKQPRRISFSADSVLAAVVQDADTNELARLLCAPDKVKVNQVNHVGLTALHHAVLSNNLDAVKLLLSAGALVNAQDVHGFSPLHTAAACGFTQVVSLLVVNGADVFALTSRREMPIDVARELAVLRLLSEEMRRRVHAEEYLGALVRGGVRDCWYHARRLAGIWLGEMACWLGARGWGTAQSLGDVNHVASKSCLTNGNDVEDLKVSGTPVRARVGMKKRIIKSPKTLILVDGQDKIS